MNIETNHSHYRLTQIKPGIECLPLKSNTLAPASETNMYLIGKKYLFLVDPAAKNESELKVLGSVLSDLIEDGKTPVQTLLTHQHEDHSSAALWLREEFNLPIASSQITKELLSPQFEVDATFSNGDVLSVEEGFRIKCLATPGHAPGHFCFIEIENKVLITGDMISGYGSILVSPTDGGHMATYIRSLELLKENNEYTLAIPSHGSPIENPQEAFQKLIEHREWREEKIKKAIESETKYVLEDIVAKAYDDINDDVKPYATLSTLATIEKLREDNWLPEDFPKN